MVEDVDVEGLGRGRAVAEVEVSDPGAELVGYG